MRKKYFICFATVLISIACFCLGFGCARKSDESKVVAKVNNYTMTVEDLEDEIEHSNFPDNNLAKIEDVLDLAIKKQVLIQEAQKQGLDRNKTFLKTIERYWEQTLIRELLNKETKRIYETISKDKQDKALEDWIGGLYKNAKIEIYKDVIKQMEGKK